MGSNRHNAADQEPHLHTSMPNLLTYSTVLLTARRLGLCS